MIAWDGQAQAAGTVLVDITQQALDGLGFARSLDLLRSLTAAGFRPSRLDLWADDREGLADPLDVWTALEGGQAVTHAHGHEWRQNSAGGATAYIGSRTSERFLRVYRTLPIHGYDGTRWELEIKGQAAVDSLALLIEGAERRADTRLNSRSPIGPLGVEAPSPWSAPSSSPDAAMVLVGLIVGFVDFRDRAGLAHGERAPRLAWWVALVGSMTRVRGAVAIKVDGLKRRAAWIGRQVAPTLAAIWAEPGYGSAWLNEVLGDGMDRLGGRPAWAST
jgi:hypothetical protein